MSETRATAFGLDIRADRDLPFLSASTVAPTGRMLEVVLEDGLGESWPASAQLISDQQLPEGGVNFQIEKSSGGDYRIWGPAYGTHVLRGDGRQLWGSLDEAGIDPWQRLLVAQALPFAAVLRGLEVLHASAAVLDGGAIAFAGLSGSGKTSLALELCRRGAEFLADDVLTLELGEELLAHPGAPIAAVDRGEAERLQAAGTSIGEVLAADRREIVQRVSPRAEPAPLQAVFLLERREDGPAAPHFEPAAEAQALLASTFNLVLADPARLARLLDVCSLAAAGRVERVLFGPEVDATQLGAAVGERIGLPQ